MAHSDAQHSALARAWLRHFCPINLQQDAFVPIRFDRQILPGTFEYALHHLLEHTVDLSAFDSHYDNDGGGIAYRPKVLLKIVLFAYARGLIGSRHIERACRENVQFMALSGEAKPDHATIAAFIIGSHGSRMSSKKNAQHGRLNIPWPGEMEKKLIQQSSSSVGS